MYTICCEALFNAHPAVFRSALVGAGPAGKQVPVLIVEPNNKKTVKKILVKELQYIAQQNEMTRSIKHFLIHPDFPVDIRHNAKIFREKLALWAARQISAKINEDRE